MSDELKTFALEQYWSEISYCLANIGKPFKAINPKEVNDVLYETYVGYITHGLIAGKYCQYGDYKECVKYAYMDYMQSVNCPKEAGRCKPECWGGDLSGVGDGRYPPLVAIIDTYEQNHDYKGALPYYQRELGSWARDYEGKTLEEKLKNLKIKAAKDENLTEAVQFIERWEKAKKLAKTEKPIPMDPVVQHHKWFYSAKPAEVLKALDYYSKNRVKFMLEKAAAHKNPVVAKKAKEYLDNWDKPVAEDNGGGGPLEKSE